MHYRLPLYERLELDPDIDSQVFYGKGQKGTKLVSANLNNSTIKHKKQKTLRIPFKTNNGTGTIPFSPFLFFSLISSAPDVILSEGASSLINSSFAFIYAKIFRKKFIWWSLGKLEGRKHKGLRGFLTKWERYIALKSDAVFTYSSLGKDHFISEGVDPKKVMVGVNVLDTDRKLAEIALYNIEKDRTPKDIYNIAFIGSITKEKNLKTLVDAINAFNDKYNDKAKLHIIGDGTFMDELKSYASSEKAEVLFHGRINEGASKILQKCDVMVLPGLGGLAICEAMLNGLPVITGKADGTEYDLVTVENGFILSEISKATIFEKLEYLYLNPHKREEMGRKSYERITTELHFDTYYSKLKEAIKFVTIKSTN